jgi:hypothetical protein
VFSSDLLVAAGVTATDRRFVRVLSLQPGIRALFSCAEVGFEGRPGGRSARDLPALVRRHGLSKGQIRGCARQDPADPCLPRLAGNGDDAGQPLTLPAPGRSCVLRNGAHACRPGSRAGPEIFPGSTARRVDRPGWTGRTVEIPVYARFARLRRRRKAGSAHATQLGRNGQLMPNRPSR